MSATAIPTVSFRDAVDDRTGGQAKVQRGSLWPVGEVPVIDQGQNFIAGYTSAKNAYTGSLPVVLFGDHTRAFKFVDFRFALGADGVKVLEPREGIDARFLYYYFRSVRLPNAGYSRHFKFLREVFIPRPSLAEQRRIVDLLSRAEGIVRLRREAQAKAQAVIPALFVDMFGDPATNPKGWNTAPLGSAVDFRSGGTPSKAREDFWIGDLPWVSPKDMKTAIINSATDQVSHTVLTETNLKLIPSGAVLIVVRGMILVHTVPVALAAVPLTINQDIKALLPRDGLEAPYLLWALKVLHDHLLAMVSTAAHGTKKLDTERLESLSLPLPPLDMQRMFARRAEVLLSVLARQTKALEKAEATFQALLARAFNNDGNE